MNKLKKYLIKKLIPESFFVEISHRLAERFVKKYQEPENYQEPELITTGEYDDLQDKLYWTLRRMFYHDLYE